MTSQVRRRPNRRSRGGVGQWMLAVIIVLAVVGTALSVFVDSKPWGPISLVLLIWGLVVAAFLLARYVRDLRAAEAKERDLKLVYELQLEREITARREYELTVERDLRADLRAESNTELSALKAEVLALRANLEELLGHDLGPTYSELYAAAQRRALEEARDGGYGRGERSDGGYGRGERSDGGFGRGERSDGGYGRGERSDAGITGASGLFDDDDRVRAQQDFDSMHPPHVMSGDNLTASAANDVDLDSYYGSQPSGGFAADAVDAEHAPLSADDRRPDREADESPTTVFSAVVDDGPDATRVFEQIDAPVEAEQPAGQSGGRRFGFGFGRNRGAAEAEPVDVEPVEPVEHYDPTQGFVPQQQGYAPHVPQHQGYEVPAGGFAEPAAQWGGAPGPYQQYPPEPYPYQQAAPQQAPDERWAPVAEGEPHPGGSHERPGQRYDEAVDAPPAGEAVGAPPAGEAEVDDPAGQHSSGRTVAELVARMNAGAQPSSGGRRRRSED